VRARILVVDDEQLIGSTIRRLLAAHEVVALTDPREALQRLTGGEHFDLVLCDLMMPDVTGMELHDRLQASRPDDAARLVFMTGGAFTERAREFLDRTGAPCVEKPFDLERLRALVAERVGGSRSA
jgi:CheY-like chemotaxis protein